MKHKIMFASTMAVGLLAFATLTANGEQALSVNQPLLYVAIDDGADDRALFVAVDGIEKETCRLGSALKSFSEGQEHVALDQLSRKR